MNKKYFITGTDTDCGKTYVTCQLMQSLQNKNHTVRALKPVASGCVLTNDNLINEDVYNILQHDATDAKCADISGWLFREPIAPHIAASDENVNLDAFAIAKFCQRPELNSFDYVLIEGAGGLMVPLNSKETWLNLLNILQIPVLLVVGMRLGCINHALLTISALHQHDIKIAGWFANCIDPNMLRLDDNINTLKDRISEPCLGIVERNGHLTINGDL